MIWSTPMTRYSQVWSRSADFPGIFGNLDCTGADWAMVVTVKEANDLKIEITGRVMPPLSHVPNQSPLSAGSLKCICNNQNTFLCVLNKLTYPQSRLEGYWNSSRPTKFSLMLLALIKRQKMLTLPALSFVPLALAPPKGCWPTTAPVHFSL